MSKIKSTLLEVRELMYSGLDEVEVANKMDLPVDTVEEMFSFIDDMDNHYPYQEPEYCDL